MRDELSSLQEISHPHIIECRSLLEDKENYYIASEFCKGGELLQRLTKQEGTRFHEKDAGYIIY